MTDEIIRRKDAIAQGLKRYRTEKPCKRRGHLAERLCSNGKCLACVREDEPARSRRRYAVNPDKALERTKRWAALNPEKRKEYTARWRAANPEKFRESNRRSKEANQKKYNETQRKDYAENPDKYKAAWQRYYDNKHEWHLDRARVVNHRRRAQLKGAGGTHTAAEAAAILVAQNYQCAYCDADLRQVKRHLDHIMPLSKGGSNDKSNIQWTCEYHNLQKGDKDPIEYAKSIGLHQLNHFQGETNDDQV
jgi:5-methylcytosine-specific restriction endonuclease McrA